MVILGYAIAVRVSGLLRLRPQRKEGNSRESTGTFLLYVQTARNSHLENECNGVIYQIRTTTFYFRSVIRGRSLYRVFLVGKLSQPIEAESTHAKGVIF